MKKGTYDVRKGRALRDVDYPNTWTVSEPRSGAYVTRQHKTRKAAIEKSSGIFHIERLYSQEQFEGYVKDWTERAETEQTTYYKEMQKEDVS